MALDELDPRAVPLPQGTKVTTRVERHDGTRRVPQGAVGRVVATVEGEVDVELATGAVVRYRRGDLVPTKLGERRYAVRRQRAWSALIPTVVLSTVVGSRAWGLAEAGSDVDRRGVFVLPFPWTTGLVEPATDLASADGSETYWEVGKAFRQALRADPNTLETLFLEGATPVDRMGEWVLEGRRAFLSRSIYGSFGRYALSQLKRLEQGRRLAAHRSELVRWIATQSAPTLDATARHLAAAVEIEGRDERDRRARAKRYIKQLYGSLYDKGLLTQRDFASFVRFAHTAHLDDEPLPRKLRPKNAYNLIRLVATATAWLRDGEPTFVATGALREQLLAIKRGEVPMTEVIAQAEAMMPALDEAREATKLPEEPDVVAADALLRRIRAEAARRHFAGEADAWGSDAPEPPRPSHA